MPSSFGATDAQTSGRFNLLRPNHIPWVTKISLPPPPPSPAQNQGRRSPKYLAPARFLSEVLMLQPGFTPSSRAWQLTRSTSVVPARQVSPWEPMANLKVLASHSAHLTSRYNTHHPPPKTKTFPGPPPFCCWGACYGRYSTPQGKKTPCGCPDAPTRHPLFLQRGGGGECLLWQGIAQTQTRKHTNTQTHKHRPQGHFKYNKVDKPTLGKR